MKTFLFEYIDYIFLFLLLKYLKLNLDNKNTLGIIKFYKNLIFNFHLI